MVSYKNKSCTLRKSIANPNAYTKQELVDILVKKLGYKKSDALKLKKEDICDLLNKSKSPKKRKSPVKSPKKRKSPVKSPRKKKSLVKSSRKRKSPVKDTSKSSLEKLGITKLKQIAKEKGISGYSKFKSGNASQLIRMILESSIRDEISIRPIKKITKKAVDNVIAKDLKKKLNRISRSPLQNMIRYKKGLECMEGLNVQINPHQQLITEHLLKNRGLVVVHSVGTGKTISSIVATKCLLDKYPDKHVVIITPKSLQDNYLKEMKKVGIDERDKRYNFFTYSEFLNKHTTNLFNLAPQICNDTILVVDEAHTLRTEIKFKKSGELVAGKTTNIVYQCAMKAFKVILLTATPVINDPYDIVPLISMAKGVPIMTKRQFELMFNNPRIFKEFFSNVLSIYAKSDKDPNYPEKFFHDVFLKMTLEFYDQYNRIQERIVPHSVSSLFSNDTNLQVFLNGIRRAVNLDLAGLENQKIQWILKKCKSSRKVLIYSAWLDAGQNIIKKVLTDNGMKVGEINGSMSIAQRTKMVNDYNSDKIKILLISKAGSEGLDLKKTEDVIILDPGWNEAGEEQVYGRAARYGSHTVLPINQRFVNIWRLYLIKPTDSTDLSKLKDSDEMPSADLILLDIQRKKQVKINKFMNIINNLSIENANNESEAELIDYDPLDFIKQRKRRRV